MSPAARASYDKLTAQGGPRLFVQKQAEQEQARAAVNDGLEGLEKLFAATDLTRVSDTDLQSASASLDDLAQQIDSSEAASGEPAREWQDACADRIARLRSQLDAAAGQAARQWAEANMPDASTGTTRYGVTGIAPGDKGSDAARQWAQDNVPEAGKIRDVTLVRFSDDGAPVYRVTYEIPDDAAGD